MARGRPSKKQQIIETALNLFSRLGYQGTSIDQVVAAAAVSKPTVYSNFSSKQILWFHALEKILEVSESELKALYEKNASIKQNTIPSACIDLWLSIWRLWLANDKRVAVYRIMLGESHKMEAESTALFQRFESVLVKYAMLSLNELMLSEEKKCVLMALTKDQLLMPLLYRKADAENADHFQSQSFQLQSEDKLKQILTKLIEWEG